MARGLYGGIGSVKKLNKLYAGIGSVRKLKQLYVGVNGVPKLLFTSDPYKETGINIENLRSAKYDCATTNVGDFAIIAGGTQLSPTSYLSEIEVYDTSLIKTLVTTLPNTLTKAAGSKVGNYAVISGGQQGSAGSYKADTYSYDSSLIKKTHTALATGRQSPEGVWNPKLAIIGSGQVRLSSLSGTQHYIDAYNDSMTRLASSSGYVGTGKCVASVGDYGLFAGGQYSSQWITTVEAFNSSFTKTTLAANNGLSLARENASGASNKSYALFAGGWTSGMSTFGTDVIDAYNTSLTRYNTIKLSQARYDYYNGVSTDDYAFYGGGVSGDPKRVEYFDTSLVRFIMPESLTTGRYYVMGAKNPKYIIFAGSLGYPVATPTNEVDAFAFA